MLRYYKQIFYKMKQFRIVSLSSQGKFVVQDKQGNNLIFPIEGFKVNPSLEFRHHFDDFIDKTIDCTLNKNGTHIRYQNQPFLVEKLRVGAMEVVQKQLQESKIYSADVKNKFLKAGKKESEEGGLKVVDLASNRKSILKYFPRQQQVVGQLEYFTDEIVIRTKKDNQLIYVPFKLKNINTMFSCLEESVFAPFFIDNKKIKVKIQRPVYNLVQKRFQINGELDPQIQLSILKNGWGIVNSSMIVTTSKNVKPEEYLDAQALSKEKHLGIFSKNTEILGFIYAKNNFVGEVSDIFDGYVFEVLRKGSQQKLKIELAMVRSPVGDETGAFNCREFARKQLIGQEVNVYLHKDSGLNITGSLVRLKDSKDVESLMVEQGWGFVREEFVNSILCMKLNELEKKAKEKLRGLHSKDIGVFRPEDLTVPNTQKQEFYYYRREQVLKKFGESQVGVLQGMFDAVSYRVWLEDKNIVLKIRLEGVIGHNINPLLEQVKAMKQELKNLYERKMKKRSVVANISEYSKEGNYFVGTISFVGGQALQQILLESSYIYADKQNAKELYRNLEEKARSSKKGIWSPNLINFEPINPLDQQGQRFKGKFSWIEDGETVFIQPESNYKTLDKILKELSSAKARKVPKEQLINGALYAAPYFGDLYRALVLSIKGKKVKVLFIDWGNKETVDDESLWELPESLRFIERQALKAKLYLARATKNEEHLQRLRGELISEEEYVFKKEKGQFVSAIRNKQNIVLSLIERGLVKSNTAMADEQTRETITKIERNLQKNRIGVWEWSDEESNNESQDDD